MWHLATVGNPRGSGETSLLEAIGGLSAAVAIGMYFLYKGVGV